MGKVLRLRGRTNHGKNRIRENGELWKVLDWLSPIRQDTIAVQSIQTGDMRWLTDDFEIVENVES